MEAIEIAFYLRRALGQLPARYVLSSTAMSSRRLWLAAALAVLASSCLSPTLPLPPPSPPDVEPLGQGHYELSGTIPVGGKVVALNGRTERLYGQLTERDYRFPVEARPGDVFLLWYEADLEVSASIRVKIPLADVADSGAAPDAD